MPYIVTNNIKHGRKITLEDIWAEMTFSPSQLNYHDRQIGTKTYYCAHLPDRLKAENSLIYQYIHELKLIWSRYQHLTEIERSSLYDTWFVPKKSGNGTRRIDSPKPELKEVLTSIQLQFERMMNYCTYHTSAYAYAKNRSTIHLVKKHQANNSRWFGHFDFSNFFGSITIEFVMKMFAEIYPFSEVMTFPVGKEVLKNLLELCFLNGGLPQGSPASPLITNIIMIPIDFKIANELLHNEELDNIDFKFQTAAGDERNHKLIYTRYADDIYISCRYGFSIKVLEDYVKRVLEDFQVPFVLNSKKTRYHSSSGSNWILGVMLNRDNQITIGYKEKKRFKSMLYNYVNAKLANQSWEPTVLQHLQGKIAYYESVEGDNIKKIIDDYSTKYNIDIKKSIRDDLSV